MNWVNQIKTDNEKNGIPLDHKILMDGDWHNFVSAIDGSNCGYFIDVEKSLLIVKNHKVGDNYILNLEGPPPNACTQIESLVSNCESLCIEAEGYFNCLPLAISTHLYCERKGINIDGFGVRLDGDCLVIALSNITGEFKSYQKIDQTGKKQFAKGLPKSGNFFMFGFSEYKDKVVVCEGFATGYSLFKSLDIPIAVAFDAGNLKSVAKQLLTRYQDVIIAADNDSHKKVNTGLVKVKEIGSELETPYSYPLFLSKDNTYSDFNDLCCLLGEEEVARQFYENLVIPVPKFEKVLAETEKKVSIDNYLDCLKEISTCKFNKSQEKKLLTVISDKVDLNPGDLRKEMRSKNPSNSQHDFWADRVIKKIGKKNIVTINDEVYIKVHQGYWDKIKDCSLAITITKMKFSEEVNFAQIKSVVNFVKINTKADLDFFDKDLSKLLIVLNNAVLEFNEDLGVFVELDKSVDINLPIKIPHNFNPNTATLRFELFLNSITKNDPDQKEKMIFFLELIGMCLVSPVVFEKFFICIGNGSNGKSVLMQLIANIVGPKNVCSVTPEGLSNRFQRAHLHGKNVNIVTELPEGGELPTDSIKSICSGELMTVENKNKDPFDFRPHCTNIFGTNFQPYSSDHSDGTMRRIEFISFNQTYVDEVDFALLSKTNPNIQVKDLKLAKKLFSEIEGIILLSIKALGNAIQRGSLTKVPSSETAKSQWRKDCNQVLQFIESRCELDSGARTSISDLYGSYGRFVEDDGIRYKYSKNKLINALVKISGIERDRTSKERCLSGIRIQKRYK